MKFLQHAGIFSVILVSIWTRFTSAQGIQRGCFDDETKHYWPVGESYNPIGRCISMSCMTADGVFDALPCAPYVPPDGQCEIIEENLTKPYPECCSTMKCKEKDKVEAQPQPARTTNEQQ